MESKQTTDSADSHALHVLDGTLQNNAEEGKTSTFDKTQASVTPLPVENVIDLLQIVDADEVNGLPEDKELDDVTEEDMPQPDDVGEYTDNLSDYTDRQEHGTYYKGTNAFASWYHRVRPLMHSRNIRIYAAANFALFLLNIVMILLLLIFGVLAIKAGIQAKYGLEDTPCLYEFGPWSECSGECTLDGKINYKTRKINIDSIVIARGKYAIEEPCPNNLQDYVEKVPCNTHACAKKLSEFDFLEEHCWKVDPMDPNKGCYKIRNLPAGDYAVTLDGSDLTQPCECPP